MPLEADKFLYDRINKEAVDEQKAEYEKINKEIKKVYSKKEDITPTEEMDERNYNFFLRKANDFGFSLFDLLKNFEDPANPNFAENVTEAISNVISDWNNLGLSLSRLKYKKLMELDKRTVKNRINEFKPSLQLVSQELQNNAAQVPQFANLKTKIDIIIRQINEDLFDQISYL